MRLTRIPEALLLVAMLVSCAGWTMPVANDRPAPAVVSGDIPKDDKHLERLYEELRVLHRTIDKDPEVFRLKLNEIMDYVDPDAR